MLSLRIVEGLRVSTRQVHIVHKLFFSALFIRGKNNLLLKTQTNPEAVTTKS